MWQNHDLESENILRNYTCVALWLNNSISSICLLLCTEKTSTAWGYQLCEEAVFIAAEEGKHLKRPSAGSWLIITMDFMAPPPSGAKAAEDKTWSGERRKNTLSSGKDETQNSARYNLLLKKKREKHTANSLKAQDNTWERLLFGHHPSRIRFGLFLLMLHWHLARAFHKQSQREEVGNELHV